MKPLDPARPPPQRSIDGQDVALLREVSRAASSLDLPELIHRIGTCLNSQRQWGHLGLSFPAPGPALGALHTPVQFVAPPHREFVARFRGKVIAIAGTKAGRAFSSGSPCAINSPLEYHRLFTRRGGGLGSLLPDRYSACAVPITYRGQRLGTLGTGCLHDGSFDQGAVRLLTELADAISPAVSSALAHEEIDQLRRQLGQAPLSDWQPLDVGFEDLLGDSAAHRRVLADAASVASTDTTVLIRGETGTGKELIARAIHRLSGRRNGPFVKVNCAAIPAALVESELFGHERGAFTGAVAQRIGRFELADGGTLFLDEVGELPREVQPKLLRVLQELELERIGGSRTIKVNVRVVAATNCDLTRMVSDRSFRSDLFYRLNVFPIDLPPLRERREDLPRLVDHFIQRAARRLNKDLRSFSGETMALLREHSWPGNIRELENLVERAAILASGPVLQLPRCELALEKPSAVRAPSDECPSTLADAERAFITSALEACRWVVGGRSGAAARLGLCRTTLQARMRKLGIFRPQ